MLSDEKLGETEASDMLSCQLNVLLVIY